MTSGTGNSCWSRNYKVVSYADTALNRYENEIDWEDWYLGDKAVFITGEQDWVKGFRRNLILKNLKATPETTISVLGQNDLVVEYWPENIPKSRFIQHDDLLEISVSRAQRLYND